MKFLEILKRNFDIQNPESLNLMDSVRSICIHSQQVQKDSLFVAIKGHKGDGHCHLKEAIDRGARVLLVEESSQIPCHFKGLILKSKNTKKDISLFLNEYYDYPSEKIFTIGLTGTNGKTTISYMLEHILNHCGWPTAVIGTIDQHFKDTQWKSQLTTPDPVEIFKRFKQFVDLNAKACVIEASSIGLDQQRVEGLDFKAAVFTNLTLDHQDYHLNLENYFQAKRKLFFNNQDPNFFSIINKDDIYGRRLLENLKSKTYSYGMKGAHFNFEIKSQNLSKTIFDFQTPFGSTTIHLPLIGIYNVYNAVASLACATVIGFKLEDCKVALENFNCIQGRLQKVTKDDCPFQVFVDYAHTPLAITSVLKTLKSFTQDKNLIIVFGCGGDRDKEKRSPMVQGALKWADQIFFTTDNPRFEDPKKIIEDGLRDLKPDQKKRIEVEINREQAIKKAISFAKKDDIILIAGKGHEKFQIVKGDQIPFDDLKIAKGYINELVTK